MGASLKNSPLMFGLSGEWHPPALADADAPNNSIYYSTDATRLVYKDLVGLVHELGNTFNPTAISDLSLWYRADAETFQDSGLTTAATADNDPVGGWKDQSGNNNHLLQSTSDNRPTLKTNIQNSLPVLRLDGTNDFFASVAGLSMTAGLTFFGVIKYNHTGAYRNVYEREGESVPMLWIDSDNKYEMNGALAPIKVTAPSAYTGFHTIFTVNDPAGNHELYIDGVSVGSANNPVSYNDGSMGFFNRGGSNTFSGDIAEIGMYSRVLDGTELNQLQLYLQNKWAT